MKKVFTLNKKNEKEIIKLNPENPYFRISHIKVLEEVKKDGDRTGYIYRNIVLTLNQRGEKANGWNGFPFFYGESELHFPSNGEFKIDDVEIDFTKHTTMELVYSNTTSNDLSIEVHCVLINNNVSLENPFENFKNHIGRKDNVKILFSAPFGQGKTTFLNHFFEKHGKEYEVFRVFPVNYSISHNEDVFKYIKTEILTQLFSKDVEFDKETFSYFLTAPQFFKNDPYRILSPLIGLIPKIGKSASEFSDKIYKLAKEYFDYHDKLKVDDKKKAQEFIKELYEKEGSVFEDNFYTQLIRQQLEKLHDSSNKLNVLVIEDLDRMDPDHIFRIMNVFAAHFDNSDKYEGYTNKFGFDKIILVADFFNVKNIFEYRYGSKVRFDGYMNKYFSVEPFFYNNISAIAVLVNDIKKGFPTNKSYAGVELFMCVLADLLATESVTLRDLTKLLKVDARPIIFGRQQRNNNRGKEYFGSCTCFNLIYYLKRIFDADSLVQKFESCKTALVPNPKWNYNAMALLSIPSLVLINSSESLNINYKFKDTLLDVHVWQRYSPEDQYLFYDTDTVKNASGQREAIAFSRSDFYDLLILNVERYEKMGGFD